MSKVKPYSDYTDFGQDWLGELPSHWKVMRTKLLFDLITEPAPVGNSEELLSVYTALGVKPRKELEARGNKASSTDNYWRVEKGDIIVNKLLAWMGAIGISEYNGVTSPAYDILRAKEGINPYFYNYLFRNPIASREFKRHSRGIMDVRLRLYFTRFGDIKLPLPPLNEQNKIVDYLQFKLKKIDRFIRKKKQLIKLLNEQKAAIINQAVTKGIDPNAKMKYSGIEWLGDIPENWEIGKLKHFSYKIGDGIHATPEYDDNGEIPFVNGNNLIQGKISITNKTRFVNYKEFEKYKLNLKIGSILISINGTIGNLAFYEGEEVVFGKSSAFIEIKDEIDNLFLFFVLQSEYISRYFISTFMGSTINNLSLHAIRNTKIFFPTKHEQKSVVKHIQQETTQINTIIQTIEKEIALTQEYRIGLIAEAITGKIDVRDYEIPASLEDESYEELEEELSLVEEEEIGYEIE
jgi:type I restriction enzyme S subunit